MINKHLLHMMADAKRLILAGVLLKWLGLACYIILILSMGFTLENLTNGISLSICLIMPFFRYFCTNRAANITAKASGKLKEHLRKAIYKKLLELYPDGLEENSTAEVLQLATDGCEQLEVYFGKYIPQLFYSMCAAVTLFITLTFFDPFSAVVLFVCVPLIPISIMLIMKLAKKTFTN